MTPDRIGHCNILNKREGVVMNDPGSGWTLQHFERSIEERKRSSEE